MVVLDLVETTPDLTLVEVQERLMKERSERFGISTIWRFFGDVPADVELRRGSLPCF